MYDVNKIIFIINVTYICGSKKKENKIDKFQLINKCVANGSVYSYVQFRGFGLKQLIFNISNYINI